MSRTVQNWKVSLTGGERNTTCVKVRVQQDQIKVWLRSPLGTAVLVPFPTWPATIDLGRERAFRAAAAMLGCCRGRQHHRAFRRPHSHPGLTARRGGNLGGETPAWIALCAAWRRPPSRAPILNMALNRAAAAAAAAVVVSPCFPVIQRCLVVVLEN